MHVHIHDSSGRSRGVAVTPIVTPPCTMGLCKCRTITSMFCFEHRKNVCEYCVITDHSNCCVKTYLQWLQDSNFDPNCSFCREPLKSDEKLIRLSCFDLFHEKCLLGYCHRAMKDKSDRLEAFKQLRCPTCRNSVLPYQSQMTGLTESVKQVFVATQWRDLTEVLMPSNVGVKKSFAHTDRNMLDHGQFVQNCIQPNSRKSSSHHAIDMGNVESWKDWYLRQGESLTSGSKSISSGGIKRVLLNFLTLRNIRCFSIGFSPRQFVTLALMVSAVTTILVFLNSGQVSA